MVATVLNEIVLLCLRKPDDGLTQLVGIRQGNYVCIIEKKQPLYSLLKEI